jgi:predicted MFS family arabinose efflux permease
LTLTYAFNFVDRQILAILQEPIKAELGLSDSQLGLLTGFAFAVFYVVCGIPIARWADRGVRRSIIALAISVWSVMTGLCGLAQSYVHLLLARIGVGVGEAGGSPPAHSMISDIFPPSERATALSTYSVGINIGIMAGFLMGGWLNEFFGWRVAFFAVCVPGLILALVLRLTLAEPGRGHSEGVAASEPEGTAPSFTEVVHKLWSLRTFRHLAFASALVATANYAQINWMPSYLIRTHGMSTGEIGTWLAVLAGVFGGVGTFLGGYLSDRFGTRDLRWYAWVPAIAYAVCIPLVAATFLADSGTVALLFHALPAAIGSIFVGPVVAVTHGMVPNRMRALASAIYFLVLNLIGMGLGPLVVGVLSDVMEPVYGVDSLRYALLFLAPVMFAWGAVHFFWGSSYIREES